GSALLDPGAQTLANGDLVATLVHPGLPLPRHASLRCALGVPHVLRSGGLPALLRHRWAGHLCARRSDPVRRADVVLGHHCLSDSRGAGDDGAALAPGASTRPLTRRALDTPSALVLATRETCHGTSRRTPRAAGEDEREGVSKPPAPTPDRAVQASGLGEV